MQKRMLALKSALPLLILVLLPLVLSAQYRAGIQGVVQDPTGAAIPGATLTLTNKDTGLVKTTTSDAAGVYNFLSLAPGNYSIKADATGFSSTTLANVVVAGEQTQAVNVQLALGTVQQSVTVQGSVAPVLNTENAQIGTTLTANQVQNMPAFGRDPYRLLGLAPGAFGDQEVNNGGGSQNTPGSAGPGGTSATSSIFQTENQVQVNADGQRNTANSFQVDGVQVNSLDWGGAAIITPSPASIKEIQVLTNSYDATLGRNSGAQVDVISQNGTNTPHGSLFFKMDRPGLNAHQGYNGPSGPTANQRVSNRFNQEAASLGGPVVKNHLFFFFAYETLRQSTTTTGTAWVETPQFLSATAGESGFIAGQLASFPGEGASYTKVLPSTCSQAGFGNFAANCQPAGSGLDIGSPFKGAARGAQDATFGQTNTPYGVGGGLDGIPDVQFVQYANPNDSTETQYNGRMDFQITQSDLLAYSIYWVPNDSTVYNGQGARPANLWHTDRLNYSQMLLWNHVFSPSLINEARFDVSRWYYNEVQSNPQEPWGLPTDNINCATGACNFTFGTPGPGVYYKTDYNIRDIATKTFNNHTLKFGTDIHKEQNTDVQSQSARPNYTFNDIWDFANDAPFQESGNFNPLTGIPTSATHYMRDNDDAVFFQDDWKMRTNLTVNLGLRWEYFGPPHEKYNNISTPVLGTDGSVLTGIRMKIGGNIYQASKHSFGPQIGFAWSPSSLPFLQNSQRRMVIRGGFGIGYNRIEEAITLNGRSNPPLIASFTLTGSNILYAIPSNAHQFAPWPTNPNAVLTFNSAGLPASGAPVDLTGYPSFMAQPYTYRYSLEAETDLGHSWVATVGYQGSASHHLTRLQNNLNIQYFPNNPGVQQFSFFTDDASGDYNALLTELQHHFSNTFELDTQFTWARSMDDASYDYYFDQYPFAAKYGWGPSDYDVTDNFKLWGVWSPVIFKSGNWLEKVVGGWTISGNWNIHSGFPWTPIYSVLVPGLPNGAGPCSLVVPNSGYCTVRPQAYVGGAGRYYSNAGFESGPTPANPTALNRNFPAGAAAYFLPPTLTATGIPSVPGVGRNTFRGPRYNSVNATLAKSFGLPNMRLLGDNARLEIRADFYNLFNKVNLTPFPNQTIGTITLNPNGTETVPTAGPNGTNLLSFGQAQNGLAGRVVELQASFNF
jgi:hypothetical protein